MATVQAIPQAAIQAVQDPNVREVLRAMADNIAVRNGDVGSGDNAFLTLGALRGNSTMAAALASALARPIADGVNAPGSDMQDLADKLQDRILGSAAWQSMFSRLQLITAPDSIPGSAAYNLIKEAQARGAAISKVEKTIQTDKESLAQAINTITAALAQNAAAIQTESLARVTADSAMASQITTLITNVGTTTAGLTSEIGSRINNDNALVQAINTMWAKVGTNSALVQGGTNVVVNSVGSVATKFDQLQTVVNDPVTGLVKTSAALRQDMTISNDKVNGLQGKWGIKMDLNGYVSGVSLNSGVTTGGLAESFFLVLADKFAVGAPGKNGEVPFAIDAQTGLVGIRGDLVVKRSITGDKIAVNSITAQSGAIADLAVGTLQIQGNAVTVPYVGTSYGTWSGIGRGNFITVHTGWIVLNQPGVVFASSSGYISYGQGWVAAGSRLLINGQIVSEGGGEEAWDNATHSGGLMCPAGAVSVQLQFMGLDSRVRIQNPTVFIMGAMK